MKSLLLILASLAAASDVHVKRQAQQINCRQPTAQTAVVDLAHTNGAPQHIASGWIYGIPDNFPNQIPLHWWTDMGFRWGKGGGAQLGNVGQRGWVVSVNDYKGRFNSTMTNYRSALAAGGDFHIYVHDLWGTDHASSSSHWPGDNGDFTSYDQFVQQLMSDVAANMDVTKVTWDIWNEPDIAPYFWIRSTQQWVDMYVRTHKAIRANPALNAMKISGPSMAFRPQPTNTWWTAWLKCVSGNNTIPDYYTYHLEGGLTDATNDPLYTNASLAALLKQYNMPSRQVFINEYAELSEQVPGGYVWWISRLERYGFFGMLGNWFGGTELHDNFGGLITKPQPNNYAATNYEAAPGWPVYAYYNRNMTGLRANTTGSPDRWLDAYATVGSDKVRILAGVKAYTGTWGLQVEGLTSVGYAAGATVAVTTYSFGGANVNTAVSPIATLVGTTNYVANNGVITIDVHQTNNYTGWAYEFAVQKTS